MSMFPPVFSSQASLLEHRGSIEEHDERHKIDARDPQTNGFTNRRFAPITNRFKISNSERLSWCNPCVTIGTYFEGIYSIKYQLSMLTERRRGPEV